MFSLFHMDKAAYCIFYLLRLSLFSNNKSVRKYLKKNKPFHFAVSRPGTHFVFSAFRVCICCIWGHVVLQFTYNNKLPWAQMPANVFSFPLVLYSAIRILNGQVYFWTQPMLTSIHFHGELQVEKKRSINSKSQFSSEVKNINIFLLSQHMTKCSSHYSVCQHWNFRLWVIVLSPAEGNPFYLCWL